MNAADVTPRGFALVEQAATERFLKRPLRVVIYPPMTNAASGILARVFASQCPFPVDRWLLGQRGNDYAAHRRRLNRIYPLRGARVLVGGCGLARDLEPWLPYRPRLVLGVDYFNYAAGWRVLKRDYCARFPATSVEFMQADMANLPMIESDALDLVGSDAVFEHLTDLPAVLAEARRILKPGGLLYASFGALWFAWGGDHVSGYDALASGYNHILLDATAYEHYLAQYDAVRRARDGTFTPAVDPHRAWTKLGLFSYLRPGEYVQALEVAGFLREHLCMVIDPKAIAFRRRFPHAYRRVAERAGSDLDPLVTGMTVIYRKPAA